MEKAEAPQDVDLSALNFTLQGRPVVSASAELVHMWWDNMDEVEATLRGYFAEDAEWCRVGADIHTVTDGSCETRLTPRPDAPGWHAESVPVEGWASREGARIPADCRWAYTRYADRRHAAREKCLEAADLRAAAATDGAAGIDQLVRHQQAQLAEWYAALDEFISSVHTAQEPPEWLGTVVREELVDWHRTREYLTSAVMEYHYGDVAPRPDTVWGNLLFMFSTAVCELAPTPAP